MAAHSFEDLVVWQKAHQYVITVYIMTKQYPKEEMFGLVNQLRRAAASTTANIAEGLVIVRNFVSITYHKDHWKKRRIS